MSAADRFFDSNVVLYLISEDESKADRAEELISQGGHISVQVLNESASVATRKLKMAHDEVREVLTTVRAICQVNPLTEETHDLGMQIAERYQLSIYDAMIAASALEAGCTTLFSEDMQDGLTINRTLKVKNPFAS
ncbi:MAG: PIN domain-containing protein [Rhodocyclaceae bacterium]|nr:PIN domain-containing protein [Rhodocyclaceae bacterium]